MSLLRLSGPIIFACACSSSSPTAPVARTCSIAQPAPSDWRLRADGTRLRDALGRVVVLRGLNAGGRSKFAPFMPFDYTPGTFDAQLAAFMDRAKTWGINAMRVPFTWEAVEPTQGQDDQDFLKRYDALLDAAWAHGIYTVVDFHQDVYAQVFCGDGFPAWTVPDPKPAPHHDCPSWSLEYFDDKGVLTAFDTLWANASVVQDQLAAMWDRMVARYKDKPGVIGFEVINEPASGSMNSDVFESTVLTPFYTKMVGRMRAIAPNSLVFVDPLGFDGVVVHTSLSRPTGDGVVFAPHFYPIGLADPASVQNNLSHWADVGTAWNVPVFVGEFGTSHDNSMATPFMSAHFDTFDALGLSGTEWEYSVAKDPWNSETGSIVAPDGTEYPVAEAVQRPFARAVAGTSITTMFDTTTKTFTLSFAPTTGTTEISLPKKPYPNGVQIGLTGACVDTTHEGELLIQPDPGATSVSLRLTSK
jgi:endoglycosylceramidase